mmetsp:Transcript_19923/g.48923  ORF Transcript_19923/g.48923 Transcript_19923/m.48923 type:complete len:230 (+) Transcript_19923:1158-1847(+)
MDRLQQVGLQVEVVGLHKQLPVVEHHKEQGHQMDHRQVEELLVEEVVEHHTDWGHQMDQQPVVVAVVEELEHRGWIAFEKRPRLQPQDQQAVVRLQSLHQMDRQRQVVEHHTDWGHQMDQQPVVVAVVEELEHRGWIAFEKRPRLQPLDHQVVVRLQSLHQMDRQRQVVEHHMDLEHQMDQQRQVVELRMVVPVVEPPCTFAVLEYPVEPPCTLVAVLLEYPVEGLVVP